MPDYVFTIKTPAELEGVKAAIERFEELRGKAKANGKDFADLDQKIASATASVEAYVKSVQKIPDATAVKQLADETERYQQSLQKMESAAHEARAEAAQLAIDQQAATDATEAFKTTADGTGEKTKLFAGHGKELRKVIQELSRDFPLAGLALKTLASPIAATLTIAVGFFVAIKRQIDDTNKKLDEMAVSAAKPLSDFAQNFRDAQNEATASNEAFIKSIAAIATAAGDVSKNSDAAINAIHRLTAAQIELNDSAQAKSIAQVNLDEARGKITPGEGISRRAQIKDFYEAQKNKTQTSGEDFEIAKREEEIAELQRQRSGVAGRLTQGGEVSRAARIKTLREQAAAARVLGSELDKPIADAQSKVDERGDTIDTIKATRPNSPSDALALAESLRVEQERRDAAIAELDALRQRQRQTETLVTRSEARAAALEGEGKAAAAAEQQLTALTARIKDLTSQLAELKATVDTNRSVRTQRGAIDSETRSIEAATDKAKADAAAEKAEKLIKQPTPRALGQDADRAVREDFRAPAAKPFGGAPALPDPSGDFIAYHQKVVAILNNLKQTVADAGSKLDDSNLS